MQATTHKIEVTRQELRDIVEAVGLLINRDYQYFGRVATTGAADETESLAGFKQLIENHRALHTRLSDLEFDLWREELSQDHYRADAEESARYEATEREIDD